MYSGAVNYRSDRHRQVCSAAFDVSLFLSIEACEGSVPVKLKQEP